MALSYNEKNKALHFEMDHGDLACHFDLEFSPVFLNMQLDDPFGIFQRIQRSSGCPPKMQARIRIAMNRVMKLHGLACAPAARPCPLEIVSTEPARDVYRLADEIETADLARLHRL